MSKMSKMSKMEVARVIDSEGLCYAITDYMSSDSIKDAKLAEMWGKARSALDDIESYLEDELDMVDAGFDDDDGDDDDDEG